MRRLITTFFLLLFGLGVGLAVGAIEMRRVDKAAQAMTPKALARRAGRAAVTTRHRLVGAWDEARSAAAEREAELRAEFNVPTARQLLGRE